MQTPGKRFNKSILSIIIVLGTTLIQYLIWPVIKPAPFLLFYPAIIVACMYANGTVAIFLSAFMGQFFFTEPYFKIQLIWPNDHVRLVFYIISIILIKKIVERQTRSKDETDKALDSLLQERMERQNFVSALTHDLQTPLTAIRLATQMLLKKSDDPEVLKKNTDRILHNVSRIDQMVQDILDSNKIKSGTSLPLTVCELDISEHIKNVIAELNLIHQQRIKYTCHEEIHGYLSPDALRRIVENLCTNAVKYGEEKTPVEVQVNLATPNVLIAVHNQGQPIPPHEQDNLFDMYKRSISAKKSGKKGWGLGLTLVKGLTQSMGGQVLVKSEAGYGTCFTVTLPLDARKYVASSD